MHGSQELVAYPHCVVEEIEDEMFIWLACGHKANACAIFLLPNQ